MVFMESGNPLLLFPLFDLPFSNLLLIFIPPCQARYILSPFLQSMRVNTQAIRSSCYSAEIHHLLKGAKMILNEFLSEK